MIVKINAVADADLLAMDALAITVVAIEGALSLDKIAILNQYLRKNGQITLVLVVDPGVPGKDRHFTNLDIIAQLDNFRYVKLLCTGGQPLESLEPLGRAGTLEMLRLNGFYKKDIGLEPLLASKGLRVLELEYGIADKQQSAVVNQLTGLHELKVSRLDAGQMKPNNGLTDLTVTNTLKQAAMLAAVYPHISRFSISYAKGVESFDFLTSFEKLEELSIGYTKKINHLPVTKNPQNIRSLAFLHTSAWTDLRQVFQYENLESLVVTEFTGIPVSEVSMLGELKKLKRVVLNFKKETDQQQFEEIAARYGWRTDIL
ncbi:hypothetical protein [Chitinophaga sp. OAE865]|uniref:hypothetical protein n=1 Tax=Chitinophaga sp. OAE865 TaxID=2817898 RepID=UPI001AE2BD3E